MKKIYPQDQGGEALNTGSIHHHAFALVSKGRHPGATLLGGGQSTLITQWHLESLQSPACPQGQELCSLPTSLGPFCLLLNGHAILQLFLIAQRALSPHIPPTALLLLPTASFPPNLSISLLHHSSIWAFANSSVSHLLGCHVHTQLGPQILLTSARSTIIPV